ncbi:major capsid protein [Tortoise microvirus 79]|nr:major capsid protein [Tortoise microvirus 79]
MARTTGALMNRKTTTPLRVPRSRRGHEVRVLSSFKAGKMVPLAAIPILREDSLTGRYVFSFEMQETAEILMNAVNVDVFAYVVPWLAFERFQGSMDILNRSWEGQPAIDGGDVVPYHVTAATDWPTHPLFQAGGIMHAMGLHARSGAEINLAYRHAYNLVWNHRAANRSPDIELISEVSNSALRPAFWKHQAMSHIVPDFDDAAMEGEVPLSIVGLSSQVPVLGDGNPINLRNPNNQYNGTMSAEGENLLVSGGSNWGVHNSVRFGDENNEGTGLVADLTAIVDELTGSGITVSLANIELARKTQAFAELRKQYEGHSDEWLIQMLMDGLTIPDQALKQPLLLAHNSTMFGFTKRYSTEAENLSESAVNGVTQVELAVNMPRLATGGVVMFFAEVSPDQLWERKQDPLLNMVMSVDDMPHYLRDTLDPQKVDIVRNEYVDMDHDTPDGLFGYAPLNHHWNVQSPRVGGKFYRPSVDAEFDEDRQRIWAVETENPSLSTDFYLTTQMHQKPFLDTEADAFEVIVQGQSIIEGNTVFGPRLIEASESYAKIMAEAPLDRIDKAAEEA